jgi:hypothetical protein
MKLLLSFLFCLVSQAAPASLEDVANSAQWHRVLYYKTHWLRGWKSAVDGEGFFLSPEGMRDPLAELKATIAALERGGGSFGKLQQPVGCALPLRKAFLEKTLQRKFPQEPCEKFDEFKAKLDPAGVSMVFATAYPNNPASMFGHSFLKVISAKNAKAGNISLLDWSINYAAMVPEDENGFAFAYFGLTGGYVGQFALVPYYAKIEEYGYLEGRDIWEYDLNLSAAERDLLVMAIWEIETNSHFDYYFFDENCSYQVLTLLEVVKPEWDISGYFVHMIPGESVKIVARVPGAVTNVRMRPSLERRLMGSVALLTGEERKSFEGARDGQSLDPLNGASMRAYLLFLQAEKKRLGDKWTDPQKDRLRDVLVRSSRLPPQPEPDSLGGEKTRPDLSHGAYQLGLGPYAENQSGWKGGGELSVRFAYHDLLDADPGYMPHSEILFPNFRFRYSERTKRFALEEAQIFSVVSLTPWNLVRKPFAWRTKAGFQRLLEPACGFCKGVHAELGAGSAWSLLPGRWTVWSFLGGQAEWSEGLPSGLARPWLELGTLYTFPWEAKILLSTRTMKGKNAGWQERFHVGLSQPVGGDWALRAEGEGILPLEKSKNTITDLRILALRYF